MISTKEGQVQKITLNRPQKMNSLTLEMIAELDDALQKTSEDESVRCVVITGAGDRAFCTGADISIFATFTPQFMYHYLRNIGFRIQRLIERMEVPVIAMVKGYCLAGGLEIALCCDMIIAAEGSQFGLTEVNIGGIPGWGGTVKLPRAIPVRKAKEMIYTAEFISAEEAYRIGLVNKVVSPDKLEEAVKELTDKICSKPPGGIKMAKNVIDNTLKIADIDAALALERESVLLVGLVGPRPEPKKEK
ncbi:MAG: enoyl-CoA hydratase/isomerase family protein [Candidatus Jordarchaeum sp.]|uniref:enoyl-CoA hydratase/isomerase family protein n=1 Tax=Candidatus Jordarchaeum sp. TaxID=2823881 RepID=UPI004049701E